MESKIKGGSFKTMNLKKQLLYNIPFENPTPIQRKTIPHILEGRSVMGIGRTGSGKTLCYLVPSVMHAVEGKRVLILVPTKELVFQVTRIYRNLSNKLQVSDLVEITTMGSIQNRNVDMLVVDEIDRILEEKSLRAIFDELNDSLVCQKVYFSATLPDIPMDIKVIKLETKINDTVKHNFFYISTDNKEGGLLHVLDPNKKSIIFTATKYCVDFLLEVMSKYNIKAKGIYSSMDDEARLVNYKDFVHDKVKILIVTDVAARGLDIPSLDVAISYDLCDEKTFLHRVGRVRGLGVQYSFVTYSDIFHFFNIKETYLPDVEIGTIPQDILDSYDLKELASMKECALRGYQRCLGFRRKVSVPEHYKDEIYKIKTHSMFCDKSKLLYDLQKLNYRAPSPNVIPVESSYKDQLFIPYSRKASKIYSSAFSVSKDDFVKDRKEKFERKWKTMRKKAKQ